MALRVLLADESSTIKKVFQLALQDFGVEVRSVNIGLDVATVAQTFKPDIVFADVLLQKKNGYDVCAELKASPLKTIPVVLMWSGFMELDEDKFQAAHANAQLEKPFDVAALRKLIGELVPRTQNQKLSQFLTFPKTPTEAAQPAPPQDEPVLEDDEEFQQMPIPKMKSGADKAAGANKYKLNLRPEELDPQHIAVEYEMPSEKIDLDDVVKGTASKPVPETTHTRTKSRNTVILDEDIDVGLDPEIDPELEADTGAAPMAVEHLPIAEAHSPGENRTTAPKSELSPEQLEEIIRGHSREVIEAVVWKVVPELAKQIIERELSKLLKERDTHPY